MHRAIRIAFFFALAYCIIYAAINSIAHGGNLLYLSHLFKLMGKTGARLVGVDVDTSRAADLNIPGLHLIQGSCQDQQVLQEVSALTLGRRTMVIADCDHSGDHVLAELSRYSPLVSVGCYYIVEDGICDVMGWNPATGGAGRRFARPWTARSRAGISLTQPTVYRRRPAAGEVLADITLIRASLPSQLFERQKSCRASDPSILNRNVFVVGALPREEGVLL
jgi:hypothetical protein